MPARRSITKVFLHGGHMYSYVRLMVLGVTKISVQYLIKLKRAISPLKINIFNSSTTDETVIVSQFRLWLIFLNVDFQSR